MYYVGVDLHKHSISVCVMIQEKGERQVVGQRRFACADEPRIKAFFAKLRTFQAVVEATANYEWFVTLIEPMADRVVLAHPKKLRVIAESTKKTDKLDARVLAEFLTLGMIPEAWRPTPRVRAHRALVRYRYYLQQRSTSVKNKLRYVLADYNADVRELFTERGREYLTKFPLSNVDRFRVRLLLQELDQHVQRRHRVDRKLQRFAKSAPARERQARQILESIPYVGAVTIDVVLSEVGDFRRFSAQRKSTAYAGLAPGVRQSDGRSKDLGITKEGSRLLRWALIQAAWRLVGHTRRWGFLYERLKQRCGPKKAIVAVARRLWCVMVSMLNSGQKYRLFSEALAQP